MVAGGGAPGARVEMVISGWARRRQLVLLFMVKWLWTVGQAEMEGQAEVD